MLGTSSEADHYREAATPALECSTGAIGCLVGVRKQGPLRDPWRTVLHSQRLMHEPAEPLPTSKE